MLAAQAPSNALIERKAVFCHGTRSRCQPPAHTPWRSERSHPRRLPSSYLANKLDYPLPTKDDGILHTIGNATDYTGAAATALCDHASNVTSNGLPLPTVMSVFTEAAASPACSRGKFGSSPRLIQS